MKWAKTDTHCDLKQRTLNSLHRSMAIMTQARMKRKHKRHMVAIPSTVSIHQMGKVGMTLIGPKSSKPGFRRSSLGVPEKRTWRILERTILQDHRGQKTSLNTWSYYIISSICDVMANINIYRHRYDKESAKKECFFGQYCSQRAEVLVVQALQVAEWLPRILKRLKLIKQICFLWGILTMDVFSQLL